MFGITKIDPANDSFRNKIMQWMTGDNLGLCDIVERTILMNDVPYVLFESGGQMSVSDLSNNMIEVEYADAFVPALAEKRKASNSTPYSSVQSAPNTESVMIGNSNKQKSTEIQKNPITVLTEKAAKTIQKFSVDLELNFITKELYNVIMNNFETDGMEVFSAIATDSDKEYIIKRVAEAIFDNFYITGE